ncbi:unnamed protein product [Blepharisma stoltei]|uniref:t-SNARE coiled-coil homology domain-containing protein n=1 Tax=Blepharisma stoltei TaxID=1481888 RepID=A0AAU9IKK7_9CILI|nr:unnamed protein product [Blepharisma stoltei]
MSSFTLNSITKLDNLPTPDQYALVLNSIRQKISLIKSSLPSLKKLPKEKRVQVHFNLQSANELAGKLQTSILKLSDKEKPQYSKWKRELEKEVKEIQKIAEEIVKIEEVLHIDTAEPTEEDTLLESPQQQNMNFELQLHHDILQERDEKISRISQAIRTVNGLLKDVSEMVLEQGEVLDLIETNVEKSVDRSKKAINELSKAEKQNKVGRMRYCLVAILAVCLVFFSSLLTLNYYKSTNQ